MVICFATSISHYFLAGFLINDLGLNIEGAAWAKNITEFLNALIIYLYIKIKNPCPESSIPWYKIIFFNINFNIIII